LSHVLDLLKDMRARHLGMFIGTPSLAKLADFLRGYDHAVNQLLPTEADSLLADFRDWVHRRFRTTKLSWEEVIRRHSASDDAAVARFWELLDEFLKTREEEPPARTSAELTRKAKGLLQSLAHSCDQAPRPNSPSKEQMG
jgi:hypothetical protein